MKIEGGIASSVKMSQSPMSNNTGGVVRIFENNLK
jgi:hypothetical protein